MATSSPPDHTGPKPARDPERTSPVAASPRPGPAGLQRRLGNRGVTNALRTTGADARLTTVKPKITAGAPDDPLEREADQTSAAVTGGTAAPATPPPPPANGQGGLAARITSPGGGHPLPTGMRDDMEARFGADFSGVRVHDGPQDRDDADRIGARAFTHQQDIWLGSKGSVDDQALMAHELTHVQQHDSAKPDIQAHWYNFSIPFTDYEFDPSISGVETAAGLVKDAAVDSAIWVKDQVVAGLEWIYERLKDVVSAGVDWLMEKYEEMKAFGKSVFNTIFDGIRGLLHYITSPSEMLTAAVKMMSTGLLTTGWKLLKSGVTLVWNGIKAVVGGVISIGTKLWDVASGFVTGLFDTIAGIVDSWAFRQLPESIQTKAQELVAGVRARWDEVREYITGLLQRIHDYADRILNAIGDFADKVTSFAIDAVVEALQTISEVWDFVKTVAADPAGFISSQVDRLAAKLKVEVPPKATAMGNQKIQEGSRSSVPGGKRTVMVQRKPEADESTRRTAGLDEVSVGFVQAVRDTWAQLDIRQMIFDSLKSLLWPIPGIEREVHELWASDWAQAVSSFFVPRSPFGSWADFAGFWHDVWSNIMIVVDFPLAFIRRLINVVMLLMGWFTILLVALGAILGGIVAGPPGILIGAKLGFLASALAGEAVLDFYLIAESASFFKALGDLFTTRQTKAQRDYDYRQMAGSIIGIVAALLLKVILSLVQSLVGAIVRGIKGFGAKPPVEPPVGAATPKEPVPSKPAAPEPTGAKPAAPEPTGAKPAAPETPPAPSVPKEAPPPGPTVPKDAPPPVDTGKTAPSDMPAKTVEPGETAPRMQEPIREMESGKPVKFGPRHAEALRQNAQAATAKWLKLAEKGRVPWESIRNQMKLRRWRFLPEAPEAAQILRDALERLPAGPERAELLEMLERWLKGPPEPPPTTGGPPGAPGAPSALPAGAAETPPSAPESRTVPESPAVPESPPAPESPPVPEKSPAPAEPAEPATAPAEPAQTPAPAPVPEPVPVPEPAPAPEPAPGPAPAPEPAPAPSEPTPTSEPASRGTASADKAEAKPAESGKGKPRRSKSGKQGGSRRKAKTAEDYEAEWGDDPRNDQPKKERISGDGNKVELQESGWLRKRLKSASRRREFMKWLEKNHKLGEAHEHLRPDSPEAEEMLDRFLEENPERPGAKPPADVPPEPGPAPADKAADEPSEVGTESGARLGRGAEVPGPPKPPARSRGATTSGVGEKFTVEEHAAGREPVIEQRPGTARPTSPASTAQQPATTTPPQPARGSTAEDIASVQHEATQGTGRAGRSPSGPEELNAPPDRRLVSDEELKAGFGEPQKPYRPPGATPPPVDAPAGTRQAWLRRRLQQHVEAARDRFEVEGYTPNQELDIRTNPSAAPRHRGSRIDAFAKDSVMNDPDLAAVITAPDRIPEPDFIDSALRTKGDDWFDATTARSWQAHLLKYFERYGRGGLLDTGRLTGHPTPTGQPNL